MDSKEERYYNRALNVQGWKQNALKRAEVAQIGVGGTGGVAALSLTEVGIGLLKLYDHDLIEDTNLHRQPLFWPSNGTSYVGKPKAEVAASVLSLGNPYISIEGYRKKITATNVATIEADVLLNCGDNYELVHVLNKYAAESKIPLVSAGAGPFSGQVSVFIPDKGPCLSCQLGGLEDRIKQEQKQRLEDEKNCIERPEATTPLANNIMGAAAAAEVVALIKPTEELAPTTITFFYDLRQPNRIAKKQASKLKNCNLEACV